MQEKPFYVHVELHKEIVKNAWIISHEGRKILVIEFQVLQRMKALRMYSPWLKVWYQKRTQKN